MKIQAKVKKLILLLTIIFLFPTSSSHQEEILNIYIYKIAWPMSVPLIKDYVGITIGNYIFFDKNVSVKQMSKQQYQQEIIRHELTHAFQYKRDGQIYFFIKYIYNFTIGLIRYSKWDKGYSSNEYEIEANKIEVLPISYQQIMSLVSPDKQIEYSVHIKEI